MKLLALALLAPSLSLAAIQDCKVNVYDLLNGERIYNHSTEGKAVDRNNVVGLRVITDDYNITSWKLKLQKERPHDTTYFNDITMDVGRTAFVMKYVNKDGTKQYMIHDEGKGKSFVFFECSEGSK